MIEGDYPGNGYKYLTVSRLAQLLDDLKGEGRGEYRCIQNKVTGNLTIATPDGSGSIAMIDFIGDGNIEELE